MKIYVDSHTLVNLSKPCLLKSLGQICIEYLSIFTLIFLSIKLSNPFISFITICLIGARQHSLCAIAHDSVHYRICKNKWLNDLIGNLFLYYPLFSSQQKYRYRHLLHHKHANSDEDPDFIYKKNNIEYIFPQSKMTFFKNVLKYTFGIHYIINLFCNNKTIKEKTKYIIRGFTTAKKLDNLSYKTNYRERIGCIIFTLFVFLALIITGTFKLYILYWIIPSFLVIPFLFRLRSICEHFGVSKNTIDDSRTMYPNWFDKIFLGFNWNLSFHLDHHLFPTVPSYNLKKLHYRLLQNKNFKDNAQITTCGTYGVFKECTSS